MITLIKRAELGMVGIYEYADIILIITILKT